MISLDKIRQAKNIGNRGEDWENIQYIAGKVQPVSPVQPTQNYTDLVNRTENVKSIMKGFGDFRVAEGRSTNIYGMGSIDLTKRPVVKNSDGTVSTIRSISFSDDSGKEILIPTVSKDGRIMSNDEAIKTYYKTGEYLGKFDTVNEANKYAEKLHQEQAVTPTTIDKPKYYNSVAEKMRAIQKKDTTPKFEQSYGTGQALPSSFGDVVKSFMFGVAENSVGWLNKLTDKMLYDWNKAAGYKKPKGYDIVEDAKKEAEADLREAHKKWDAAKDPAEYAKLQEEFAATMSEGEKKVKEAETKKAVDTRRTFLGQDEYWEPTESTEKAEAIGQVGGGVLKTIGISSLAGLAGGLSSGVAKDIVTRTITGIGLGLAKGIEEDADLQDFLVNIGRETLYMNVGGAASDVVGGLTLKQIMSSPYKDSLLAEVGRQALKGAAFGAAGTAATMPTYPEGQKPTVKDIAIRAATGALFDAVTGLARELKLSEYNKNRILGGMAEFEGELLRGLGEAKTSASPEEAIAKYESLLEQVEASREALKQNRFIGQTEKVKEALSIMDYIHNRISLEVDGLKPATPQIGGTDIRPVTSPAITQPVAPQPATAKPAVTPAVPQTRLPDTVPAQQPTPPTETKTGESGVTVLPETKGSAKADSGVTEEPAKVAETGENAVTENFKGIDLKTETTKEDEYDAVYTTVSVNGENVGQMSMLVSDTGAYIERMDVFDEHQSKGYGTKMLQYAVEKYGHVYTAPDNEGARRLYDRLGYEMTGAEYDNVGAYVDQGFGVYVITSIDTGTKAAEAKEPTKEAQLKVIQETNPAPNKPQTWVRSVDDIKTYQEAVEEEGAGDQTPDYTESMIKKAIETGRITVYSSYPIEPGVFVTPSKMEAASYAGSNKVHEKEVALSDVAWLDVIQGQYAPAETVKVETKAPAKEPPTGTYRYYTTQRPPAPGAVPGKAVNTVAFDDRQDVPDVGKAWGYVEYAEPLTEKQISEYELAKVKPVSEYQQKRDKHDAQADEIKRYQMLGIEKTGVRLQDAEATGRMIELFYKGEITQEQLDKYINSLIYENRISDKSVLGEELINKALASKAEASAPKAKTEQPPAKEGKPTSPKADLKPVDKTEAIEKSKKDLRVAANEAQLKKLTPAQRKMYDHLYSFDGNSDALLETLNVKKASTPGFTDYQRQELIEGLVKGYLGEKPFDKGQYVHVSIPDDGTFDVTNQPLHVAAVLNKLGVEVASGLDLIPKPLLKAIKAAYKKSAIGSYKDDVLIGGYFAYRLSPDALGALKKEYEKMGEYTSKIDITDRLLGASFYDDEKVLTEPYITKSKFMDMYKNSMLFIGQDNNLNFFNKTYVDILKDKNVQLYLKEMAPGDKNKALLGVRDNEVTGFVLPIAKEHADKEYLDNLANPEYFMPAKGYVAGDKAISKAKSVPSEYEGAKPGDIDYKPIRVGMQTQIVSGTPSGQTSPYTFADPDIEETHQKNKGVPVATFAEKVTNAMTELKHMFTRPISTLPYTPEFAKLYFRLLNNFRSLRGMVADSTIRTLKDITGKMTNNEFDLFSRKVLLDDLAEDVKLGNKLPNKWTPDMVDSELKRLDAVMPQIVKDGIAKRKKYWADLVDEFIAAKKSVGLDVADTFERKDYFRHQVLEYMDAKRSIRGAGKRLKSPARAGFEMQRSGEYEGDINTDYFQAEYEVMAQMKYNIGVIETINYIDKHYNIADKVKAAAKAMGLDNWRDAIPEGYTIWQPKPGNVFYLRQPLGADLVTRVLANENLKLDDVKDPVLKKALEDIMNELAGETAVLAMGGKRKEWVVKQEVADTLNNLNQAQPTNVLTRTSTRIQNEWKRWVTGLNPKTTIKFGVRNVSGDLEGALQGNPRTLLRVPKAIKELREAIYNGNFTPDILEWYNMGGMQSLFYPREVSDVDKLEPFKKFRKLSLGEKLTKPLKDYAGFTEDMHDFREAILRYASYLDYMDQLREGKLLNYGASNRKLIDALGSNEEKAFKLSNDLIGGYNEISQFGQVMRKHFVPFYSWEEIAVKRQFNLLRNAFTSEDAAKAAGVSAATIAKLGLKTVGYLVKMFAFTAAVAAFNMLKFSDLIDEIPEDVKARPYLILGKNKNGQVIYFSRLGALTEVLEWVGLDSAPQDIKEILNGEKMLSEWTTEILKAPLNKAMSTLTPFIKTPLELLSGMSIYPDATKPRAIRDRWQHLAQSLSLRDEYDVLAGKPHRPYFENLDKALIYKSDPLEAAYYEILNAKRRYKERKGEESLSFFYTKKSNALYNYKLAIRYGDEKAQEKYLKEYEKYGGNSAQTIRNIITMSPYYGIAKDEREDFKNSLGSDKKKLEQAEEFFIDMLKSELSSRRPITAGTQLMIDLYRETGETLQFPKTVATKITVNKVDHKLTTDEIIEYQNLANDAMYKRADTLAKNTKILSLPPMEQVQILSDELNKQVAIVREQWKKRYR